MPRAECTSCGSKLAAKSRFCPECGARVEASAGETAVQELPPTETGPVPVQPLVAERRLFGVPPSTLVFGIGVASWALAILLFVFGHWVWGLVLLAFAAFVLAGFIAQTRRLPSEASGVARASLAALDAVRARAEVAVETVAAHGSARIELVGLRRGVGELTAERGELLRELGEAVYEGNKAATRNVKKRITELDGEIEQKEEEMTKIAMEAKERIDRAQLQVQPTQIVPRAEEPAQVPEPFPPPGEGEPPQPVPAPEPYPPPDEGDRPQQPTIPEPGPQ